MDPESEDDIHSVENDDVSIRNLHEGFQGLTEQLTDDVSLPKHQRCAAHTLNLVATNDLKKIPGWTCKKTYTKALNKCNNMWRKQNMSSTFSGKIKSELGCKLRCPTKIRWNSLQDALTQLSSIFKDDNKEKYLKLRTLMETTPGLEPFTDT